MTRLQQTEDALERCRRLLVASQYVSAVMHEVNNPLEAMTNLVHQAFRTLSRMLHIAVEWRELRAAPRIKLLKELGRTAIIDAPTEALLLEHAPQPLADVLVIILDCGMRPEEVMRMRWENVMWDRSVVLVPSGKTLKAKRYVPLSKRMRSILLSRVGNHPVWVFPSKRAFGGHITTVNKGWRQTVVAANVDARVRNIPAVPDGLALYCARHTFATDMLSEGQSVGHIKEFMGHEDVKPP